MRCIDADALERDGWSLCRVRQEGTDTLSYEVKKPTDFTSVEPERKPGKWIDTGSGEECDQCHEIQLGYDSGRYFCANCGSMMTREVTYERGKP